MRLFKGEGCMKATSVSCFSVFRLNHCHLIVSVCWGDPFCDRYSNEIVSLSTLHPLHLEMALILNQRNLTYFDADHKQKFHWTLPVWVSLSLWQSEALSFSQSLESLFVWQILPLCLGLEYHSLRVIQSCSVLRIFRPCPRFTSGLEPWCRV